MAGQVRIAASSTGLRLPGLVALYGADTAAAVKAGVEGATAGLVQELRQEIAAAFPGSRRLPTTITGKAYPDRGVSLNAAAWVRPRSDRIGAVLATFVDGTAIRARQAGTCLAIPTARVPRVAGRKMTPDEVRRRFGQALVVVPPRPGSGSRAWGALVLRDVYLSGKAERLRRATRRTKRDRVRSVVMFILVPAVQMPRLLAPEASVEKWAGQVPALIERAAARLGV